MVKVTCAMVCVTSNSHGGEQLWPSWHSIEASPRHGVQLSPSWHPQWMEDTMVSSCHEHVTFRTVAHYDELI